MSNKKNTPISKSLQFLEENLKEEAIEQIKNIKVETFSFKNPLRSIHEDVLDILGIDQLNNEFHVVDRYEEETSIQYDELPIEDLIKVIFELEKKNKLNHNSTLS